MPVHQRTSAGDLLAREVKHADGDIDDLIVTMRIDRERDGRERGEYSDLCG